jgi:lipopolysaccharide heptosyltransferase II
MPSRTDSAAALLPSLPDGARLLVVRMRSLGDALLLTPALRALKQWRPDFRISVLLYARFAPILDANPDVEEIISLDAEGPTAPLVLARTVAHLRAQRFRACFNLHGSTLSALLTLASGAPHRLGLARHRLGFAYTDRAPDPRTFLGRQRLHTVEVQFSLFQWAGLPTNEIPPLRVFPQPAMREAVARRLEGLGVARGRRFAVLHPVANFFTKEWPFERYAALAEWLEEELGLVPVFVAGPGERAKLDAVERAGRRGLRRLESLPLPELVALIELASLYVGNDSGPAHIAAALDRPAVVLFGSSDSAAWGPWPRGGSQRIVQNEFACNPCRGDRCYAFEKPECILSLTQEQVRAAIAEVKTPGTEELVAVRARRQ